MLTGGDGGAAGVESRWRMAPLPSESSLLQDPGPVWRLERERARGAMPAVWRLQRDRGRAVLVAGEG